MMDEKLRPFQRRFIKAVESSSYDTVALSGPRGLGKTFLAGHVLARALTPGDKLNQPGAEYVLGAASLDQARMTYAFVRAALEPTGEYRFIDSTTRLGITHKASNTKLCDRRQLVLPVATTIFAGRYGVIIRYGGTVDYRPTNQAIEAETYGRQDTGNGSGQGWDERAFSAQVAEWAIAVAGETGASVAHSAGSLRRGVGG